MHCRSMTNVQPTDQQTIELFVHLGQVTVPEDYDINPQTSRRGDRSHHPELRSASVEYVAPSEYMVSENDRFWLVVPLVCTSYLHKNTV